MADDPIMEAIQGRYRKSPTGLAAMPRNPARMPVAVENFAMDATVNPLWDIAKGVGAVASDVGNIGSPEVGAGLFGAMGLMVPGARGIRAFHGSPHKVEKFDITKADRGPGLHFATKEKDAKFYGSNMHEVNLNAPRSHFIDPNKTVGEQSRFVKAALREAAIDPRANAQENVGVLLGELYPTNAERVERLRSVGIPGQRTAYGFAVFDDKIIDILKRYGLAGLPAGGVVAGGMSQMDAQ